MGKLFIVLLSFAFVLVGILYRDSLQIYFNNFIQNSKNFSQGKSIYTPEQLSKFNGVSGNRMYLAILGTIFDVSKGIKHYGDGSPYNYFVGKDGSRAFTTGDFKDESTNKDHILDLTCDELLVLLNWKKTMKEKYRYVGKVIGRYFDHNGKETEYMNQFNDRIDLCKQQKEKAKQEEQKYPPCNISWSAEEGTTVWCTKSSGGITRSWTGVPRQLYTPGKDKPHCVCVNITNNSQAALFKEYDNCSSTSTLCHIRD
ncbi:unnamed protein product [Chilo suppressalis]|uniref:Cytochrome b5 heme-binding domain-containing protein n=1 Tax=Chilo suppressalis TaxID=168631 RepID=A0ABN8BF31_CHISP|nr:hypothetical protein evm_006792 [Chilo suppressalis]CAH0406359.1 unnamed protein product [Chilo suppressalis]